MGNSLDLPRFLVVGCGAIGGVLAASLLDQGLPVTVLTTNPLIAAAIRGGGIRVGGETALPEVVPGREVWEAAPRDAPAFDFIMLATQPPQVEQAARSVAPLLKRNGKIVCLQNGLCEERVAPLVGRERVVGAVVAWGASMLEAGVYDRTSSGGFTVGPLDGTPDARIEELGRWLEAVGPVTLTDNLLGARFSKLAINCAISTLGTIGGDRLGALMRHRFARRLCLEIMTEVVAVARAQGIRLEKVSGTLDLEWIALTSGDRAASGSPSLVAKHTLLLAVGARYRRLRSSMLAAIERGRVPSVDFLNGEIVERGRGLSIPVPVNSAARDLVWAIAEGRERPGSETLHKLYDGTR